MKRKLFFIICLILFLFLSPKLILAAVLGPDCNEGDPPCPPGSFCDGQVGQKACRTVVNTITGGSLQNFQETIINARNSGEMPRERWIADPQGSFLVDLLAGVAGLFIGEPNQQTVDNGNLNSNKYAFSGGVLGLGSKMLSSFSSPPASSIEYFADLGSKLGIAKPVYAQGIGFSGMSALLPLWKAFRNISYFIFVIIFVVVGLAIMFRIKLDPKTVITIQNALPKMIIALVLITFSYAIAGLLIDLIYVILYATTAALGQIDSLNLQSWKNELISMDLPKAFGYLTGGLTNAVYNTFFGLIVGGVAIGVLALFINPLIGAGIAVGSLTIPVIICCIIALYCIFKLFIALTTAYVKIIIAIIFAPLQIMIGAFPGSSGGFSSWFKGLLENIIVFPAVAIFIMIGNIVATKAGPTWSPPVLGGSGQALTGIIAFGFLFLTSNVPQIIHGIFIKKPLDLETAIGKNVADTYKMAKGGYDRVNEKSGKTAYDSARKKILAESEATSALKAEGKI